MTGGTLLAVRSYDSNVAERLRCRHEAAQSVREDAVVIRAE
jgi:hypothetical protein